MSTVLPIDILYPIVSEVVVDCIDELFTSQEPSSTWENPKITPSTAQLTIHSLFLTSLEIRRIALKVVVDGLNVELSTTGIWHLHSNPWRTIQNTLALAAQTIQPLTPSAAPPTRPVHAFFALYLSAQRDLAYAQKRLAVRAQCTASLPSPSHATSEPLAYARHAACKAAHARAAARLAPAVYRARLGERARELEVRLYAFMHLRVGAHDLAAKLSDLVGRADGCSEESGTPSAADCLIALEQALGALQVASLEVDPVDDALVGGETLTAVRDALRTVTTSPILSSDHAPILNDVSETRTRCHTLATALLEHFEQRLASINVTERATTEARPAQVRI